MVNMKNIKTLISVSDFLERKDELKAFVQDIRKEVELTDEQIAKQKTAMELIAKGEQLKSELSVRENALKKKESDHEKSLSGFSAEKEKYHNEVINPHMDSAAEFEKAKKRFYEVSVPNLERREAKLTEDIIVENERQKKANSDLLILENSARAQMREAIKIKQDYENKNAELIKLATK